MIFSFSFNNQQATTLLRVASRFAQAQALSSVLSYAYIALALAITHTLVWRCLQSCVLACSCQCQCANVSVSVRFPYMRVVGQFHQQLWLWIWIVCMCMCIFLDVDISARSAVCNNNKLYCLSWLEQSTMTRDINMQACPHHPQDHSLKLAFPLSSFPFRQLLAASCDLRSCM